MSTKAGLGLAIGVGVGLLLAASDGSADAKRSSMDLKAVQAAGVYTGGALDLEITVESWGPAPSTATLKLDYGSGSATQAVAIPGTQASVQKKVKLTDPNGLTSSCSPRTYTVSLSNGDPVNDSTRTIEVTPTCKFTSSIADEWNQIEPDRVVDAQKDSVYLQNVALETAPTCTAGPKLKAQIVNHTKVSSPSLIVQAKAGDVVKAQTAAAFPLAASDYKEVVLTPVGAHDPAPKLDVVITDWTHGLGTKVNKHGITVTTTRSCTLAVGFAAPPARALSVVR